MAKVLGAAWKDCPPADKARYQKEYEIEKADYDQKLKAYKETDGYKAWAKGKKTFDKLKKSKNLKKKMLVNQPKRPMSAFMLFAADRRAEVQKTTTKVTDVLKVIGQMWKEVSEADKQPFQEEAARLKSEYLINDKAYKQTDEYQNYLVEQAKTKKSPKKTKKARGRKRKAGKA